MLRHRSFQPNVQFHSPFSLPSFERTFVCDFSSHLRVNIEGIILYMNYFNQWQRNGAFITRNHFCLKSFLSKSWGNKLKITFCVRSQFDDILAGRKIKFSDPTGANEFPLKWLFPVRFLERRALLIISRLRQLAQLPSDSRCRVRFSLLIAI